MIRPAEPQPPGHGSRNEPVGCCLSSDFYDEGCVRTNAHKNLAGRIVTIASIEVEILALFAFTIPVSALPDSQILRSESLRAATTDGPSVTFRPGLACEA
jgi:hypothetical protein